MVGLVFAGVRWRVARAPRLTDQSNLFHLSICAKLQYVARRNWRTNGHTHCSCGRSCSHLSTFEGLQHRRRAEKERAERIVLDSCGGQQDGAVFERQSAKDMPSCCRPPSKTGLVKEGPRVNELEMSYMKVAQVREGEPSWRINFSLLKSRPKSSN